MRNKYRDVEVGSKGSVRLALSVEERVKQVQAELHGAMSAAVRELAEALLLSEVEQRCGKRYEHSAARQNYRYGKQSGVITAAGQKLSIDKPRVRRRGGGEVELQNYQLLNDPQALQEPVIRRMVRGVSTRDYSEVVGAFEDGYGIKRSSVSRSFVRASKAALERLLGGSFVEVKFAAIMIDGVEYAGMTVIVALGIDSAGNKHVLGLKEGATENAIVVRDLLCDLRERGVTTEQPTLFIIDGGKALAKGISEVFGANALLQRCQIHKKRNLRSYLAEEHWEDLDTRLAQAWRDETSYADAIKSLKTTASWLERISPEAAGSLREGLEQTVTVKKFGVRGLLYKTFATTNPIESTLSVVRTTTRNVKRWQDGDMRLRWCAAGLLRAQEKFHRVKGAAAIAHFLQAINLTINQQTLDSIKEAA